MFKVICILTNNGFGIVKGEIYTVEVETCCPVCGSRVYRLRGFGSFIGTSCVGDLEPTNGGFTNAPIHHQWMTLMMSAKFFRLVDYSFGEKIATDIEIEESKKSYKQL